MSTRRRPRAAKIVLLVAAGVAAVAAVATLAGGGALLWLDQTKRDADGYFSTGTHRFASQARAIATDDLDLDVGDAGWLLDDGRFGTIRIEATGTDPAKPLFVGIAPRSAVVAYLDGVRWDRVENVDFDPFRLDLAHHEGGAPAAAPGSQSFWVASTSGPGDRTLTWDVSSGKWAVVVMNADGSPGVDVELAAGAKVGFLLPISGGLLGAGAILVLLAGGLVLLAGRTTPPGEAPGSRPGRDRDLPAAA
jgi:hypothetical protein